VNRFCSSLALALVVVASVAACVDADVSDSSETLSLELAGSSFFRVEATSPTATTVVLINGGAFTCPGTASNADKRCTVERLALPADCGWECRDGLLSLRGVTILAGHLDRVTEGGRRVSRLVATAGWDTWRAGGGPFQYYRVTPAAATCDASPCPGALRAQRLNGAASPRAVTSVDFAHADDINYVLDPTRGLAQASSEAGLLASGVIRGGVLQADRVLRLWTPAPACDPQQVARAHWFHGGEDVVDVELTTVALAERHVDELGRSVHWLVRDGEDPTTVDFVAGINDLWAQRIAIDKATCELTVTGEH
jgi:hypothetical protein